MVSSSQRQMVARHGNMSPVPFPNQRQRCWLSLVRLASSESSRFLMGMSSSHNSSTHNRWTQQKYLLLSTTSSPIRTVRAVWYRSTTGKLLFNSLQPILNKVQNASSSGGEYTYHHPNRSTSIWIPYARADDSSKNQPSSTYDSVDRSSHHHPKLVTWEDVIDASAAADDSFV